MSRYFLNTENLLAWLLEQDDKPDILPRFPDDNNLCLVVAYLASGHVVAEVIPSPRVFEKVCGPGVPLGRLYFQIEKNRLYSTCKELSPEAFEDGGGSTM